MAICLLVTTSWLPGPGRPSAALLLISLVVGSFVFTAVAEPQPNWVLGPAFGLVIGAGAMIALIVDSGALSPYGLLFATHYDGGGTALIAYLSTLFLLLGALAGAAGGAAAEGLGRAGTRPNRRRNLRLQPWRLGGAIAVLGVVLLAVAAI